MFWTWEQKNNLPPRLNTQIKMQVYFLALQNCMFLPKKKMITLRRKLTGQFGAHASFHGPQYRDSPKPMLSFHPLLDFSHEDRSQQSASAQHKLQKVKPSSIRSWSWHSTNMFSRFTQARFRWLGLPIVNILGTISIRTVAFGTFVLLAEVYGRWHRDLLLAVHAP